MQRQSGSFALPNIRGIAVIFVQLHGGFDEFADDGGGDGVASAEFEGGHFVFAAGFQARLDLTQKLPAPEAEEDPFFFRTDEEHRTVTKVNEMAPLDDFLKLGRGFDGVAQGGDAIQAPAGHSGEVGSGIGGRSGSLHGHG